MVCSSNSLRMLVPCILENSDFKFLKWFSSQPTTAYEERDSFVVAELQQASSGVGPRKGYPLQLLNPNRPSIHPEPVYFATIRRGGAVGVGAGGEIVNVTQVFQPWARFSASNSL